MINISRNTLINDIADNTFDLSTRSVNICEDLGLRTLQDLHDFIEEFKNFRTVRNCGSKSNMELLKFHNDYYVNVFERDISAININIIKDTPINDDKFNSIISLHFERLTVRAKNVLNKYLNYQKIDKRIIKEYFIDKSIFSKPLKNAGNKTISEIEEFVAICIDIYYASYKDIPSDLEFAKNELYSYFKIEIENTSHLQDYLNKRFPLLTYCYIFFQEKLNLNALESFIVRNEFRILDKYYKLDEISKIHNKTKERIRQIKNLLGEKIKNIFSKFCHLYFYTKYEVEFINKDFIIIPDGVEDENLRKEIELAGVPFSTFILGLLNKETFYSVTFNDKLERPNKVEIFDIYKKFKQIKGSYLINKRIISKKDLIVVLNEIFKTTCIRHKVDQTYDLRKIYKGDLTSRQDYLISNIIENEFGLQVNYGHFTIKRTTSLKVFEYAKEALENIGKPAHISEIVSNILKDHPDYDINEASLRSSMGQKRKIFICFGRSSTFGLKIWEKKYQNIKGGTIRDIVEEFLNDYNEPCHISAITNYVNRYRKTDENSVINNLKMSREKRFIFLKDGYVGIAGKIYNKTQNIFKPYDVSLDDLMDNIFLK